MQRHPVQKAFCLLLSAGLLLMAASCGQTPPGDTGSAVSDTTSTSSSAAATAESTDATGSTQDTLPATSGSSTAATTSQKTEAPGTTTTAGTTKSAVKTSLTLNQFMNKMPEKLRGTTLTFLYWEDLRNRVYKEAVENFEAKTGITLKTELANKEVYETQLAARITAGNSPDLFKVIYNYPGTVSNLQPITNCGYDFHDTAWDEEVMSAFTFNGKVYAVNVQNSPNRNASVIYYNKKALKRAGMEDQDPYTIWKNNPEDWTWDTLWSMCDTFLKANGNGSDYFGITGLNETYAACFGGCFWYYDYQRGKAVSMINSQETVKRYEILIDAISKRLAAGASDPVQFETGKILFSCGYSSATEKDNGAYTTLIASDNLGVVPVPTDSTKQPLFEYSAYGIPVGAKNAEAVPYFLRYVFSPEGNDLDNFYINDQAREVIEYVSYQDNTFFGSGYTYEIWQKLLSGNSSQVKSVLDSYAGVMQQNVDDANAAIAKLP